MRGTPARQPGRQGLVADTHRVRFRFAGELVYWRGPSPFHFVVLPPAEAAEIRSVAQMVTYGWGVIPVEAEIDGVAFTTSLFPRDRAYLLPVKDRVRKVLALELGDVVEVDLRVRSATLD
jgi:hypothetical protein